MKVYIVLKEYLYEGDILYGVFATEKMANDFADKKQKNETHATYIVEDWNVIDEI